MTYQGHVIVLCDTTAGKQVNRILSRQMVQIANNSGLWMKFSVCLSDNNILFNCDI